MVVQSLVFSPMSGLGPLGSRLLSRLVKEALDDSSGWAQATHAAFVYYDKQQWRWSGRWTVRDHNEEDGELFAAVGDNPWLVQTIACPICVGVSPLVWEIPTQSTVECAAKCQRACALPLPNL